MTRTSPIGWFLAVAVAGCVRTTTDSYTDPAYTLNAGYQTIVVIAKGMGLHETMQAEDALAAALTKKRLTALRGIDVIPPTRKFSAAGRLEAIRNSGADAILVITTTEKSTREYITPAT